MSTATKKPKTPSKKVKSQVADVTPKKGAWEPKQMADALKRCHGLIATAARVVGCSRKTIYEYIKKYPEVAEAREEAREFMLDAAELGLAQSVKDREAWAICFLLKTQGKNRGYSERQELTGKDGAAIQIEAVIDAGIAKVFGEDDTTD